MKDLPCCDNGLKMNNGRQTHPENCWQAVSVRIVDQVDKDEDCEGDPSPVEKLWAASLLLRILFHLPLILVYLPLHPFHHYCCTASPRDMRLLRVNCCRQGGEGGRPNLPKLNNCPCHMSHSFQPPIFTLLIRLNLKYSLNLRFWYQTASLLRRN